MNSDTCCPKCGSSQISANTKGYSVGKGVLGWVVAGPLGLLGGLLGSKTVMITCLSCGNVFKPGSGVSRSIYEAKEPVVEFPVKVRQKSKAEIEAERVKSPPPQHGGKKVICLCGSLNETNSTFCRVCGMKIDRSKMEEIKNGQSFECVKCPICHANTTRPSRKNKFCTSCGEGLNLTTD